jgi:putative ABC transport system ATP-binding protein
MIRTTNLSYTFQNNHTLAFPDVAISQGEQVLLLGESGSGKTTLLHLMGGLLRGYAGNILINKTELATLSEAKLDAFRGKQMGFVFQRNHLISALTVEKNIMMAPFLAGVSIDRHRVQAVLKELGLEKKSTSAVTEISHGQAQRVAIARAVINRPAVIFADEPTSALDDKSCDRVINHLLDVASENNSTLVVATHDQRLKNVIQKHILLHS